MKLTNPEKKWIKANKQKIGTLLDKRINDLKEVVIKTEDPEKREKVITLIREMKNWQGVFNQNQQDKDQFTGV